MKTTKFFAMAAVAAALALTACNDDDDDGDSTPPPVANCPDAEGLSVSNVDFTSAELIWNSTDSEEYKLSYGLSGYNPSNAGTEIEVSTDTMFVVTGLSPNSTYDFYVASVCDNVQSNWAGPVSASTPLPLIGSWTAYDVSPLLAGLGITGITAEFNANNTYTVVSIAGASETELTGTYVTSDQPNAEGIYTITLNQSSPNSLTSEGIFAIYFANPDSMWYEVAQTSPSITGVTAPTAEAGFGSTSGGAFGQTNIQKYTRD